MKMRIENSDQVGLLCSSRTMVSNISWRCSWRSKSIL